MLDIISILLNLLRHILWPGIYASNIYVLAMTIKNVSKYCQMSPNVSWKANHHQLRTTTLGQSDFLLKYKFNRDSSIKRHRFDPCVGKIPLGEGMATHSSILAWRIPMDRGACQATVHGVQRIKHDWSSLACSYCLLILTLLWSSRWSFIQVIGSYP